MASRVWLGVGSPWVSREVLRLCKILFSRQRAVYKSEVQLQARWCDRMLIVHANRMLSLQVCAHHDRTVGECPPTVLNALWDLVVRTI